MTRRQWLRGAIGGALVLMLAALARPVVAADERRRMTVDDLMKVRHLPEVRISPDGAEVLYVVSAPDLERNQQVRSLWSVPSAGGAAVKLDTGHTQITAPRWSPDGQTIAFLSKGEGGSHIWLLPRKGGKARQLTRGKSEVKDLAWSPKGQNIAYLAAERSPDSKGKTKKDKSTVRLVDQAPVLDHLYRIDVAGGKAQRITAGNVHVADFSWAPDGQHLAYAYRPSPRADDMFHSKLAIVPATGGKPRSLVDRPGLNAAPHWSPDGKQIAFVSLDGQLDWIGNTYLCAVPAAGGKPRNLSKAFDEKIDGSSIVWSADGKTIYFAALRRLTAQLFALSVATGEVRPITSGQRVHERFSFSRGATHVAFVAEGPTAPPEAHVSSLARFAPKQLTTLNPQLEEIALGSTEVVRWKGRDGLEIEGLVIKPVGYKAGARYPLLTYVHGGPAGLFRLGFTAYGVSPQAQRYPIQVFAGKGYAVFCPNPRGSGGYGDKFRKANVKDWGGEDYHDIQNGIDHLIARGLADRDRLGLMGWSYGGYMTSWSITQTNRFKAASAGAAVTNPASFYGQTDIPSFLEAYFGAPPWEAPATYAKASPMTFAGRIATPTLIQHGATDDRVPLAQGEELYRALRRKSVPVEFAVYPGQGHQVLQPRLQADVLRRNVAWFGRWLKKAP